MNWDRIEGNWKQMKGKAREKWGRLTDSDWEQVAGRKDQLIGRIQERYGIAKEQAEEQVDQWAQAQAMETHEPASPKQHAEKQHAGRR
ncbi:MAG TPA: CsbD family protein [Bryobacteraceae bacterium]|nr:CsbD family protein [Bryobacteraceae bacterium]